MNEHKYVLCHGDPEDWEVFDEFYEAERSRDQINPIIEGWASLPEIHKFDLADDEKALIHEGKIYIISDPHSV